MHAFLFTALLVLALCVSGPGVTNAELIDFAGGATDLRAQANAYDASTIEALRTDLRRITPLFQRVK
jgi:hypothetical protein